jgi:hypothetical protein
MPSLVISAAVREKLEVKHGVREQETRQCLENRCGEFLIDDREDHRTVPPTLWFIAETNRRRRLKIVFVFKAGNIHIKTAYQPNANEIAIYDEKGK